MTERLYYADSYTTRFAARVTERLMVENRPAVVLNRTFFYPSAGGQPFDRGTLDGVPVVAVTVRPADGGLVHTLGGPLEADEVNGEVDWARRFDHMQQHSGQHILSQAFLRVAGAETVAFHLSENSVTIDVASAGGEPPDAQAAAVEDLANRVVMDDVAVRAWFPTADELAGLRLRRTPEGLAPGTLRVVAIGDFDFNACGGTHVARTGEIGQIKIVKLERRGKDTRVEFRCGWRALADYRRKNELAQALAAEFTCAPEEVPQAIERLRAEGEAGRRALKAAQENLLDLEAERLAAASRAQNGWQVVRQVFADREAVELRGLASRLAARPNTIALLGTGGEKAQLVFARAEGLAPDMRAALKNALAILGSGRGGGSPALAQGGGAAAQTAQIEQALEGAEGALLAAAGDNAKGSETG